MEAAVQYSESCNKPLQVFIVKNDWSHSRSLVSATLLMLEPHWDSFWASHYCPAWYHFKCSDFYGFCPKACTKLGSRGTSISLIGHSVLPLNLGIILLRWNLESQNTKSNSSLRIRACMQTNVRCFLGQTFFGSHFQHSWSPTHHCVPEGIYLSLAVIIAPFSKTMKGSHCLLSR